MESEGHRGWTARKAIPEQRDQLQSQILVWAVGVLLAIAALPGVALAIHNGQIGVTDGWMAVGIAIAFGLLAWRVRAATFPAAVCGSAICLLVTVFPTDGPHRGVLHSGLSPLAALFLLTFASTRLARARGVQGDDAERRKGRRASQIVANLGWAGLLFYLRYLPFRLGMLGSPEVKHRPCLACVLVTALLAEATADTVSSEIGQAYGGNPYLIGGWRRVQPGTDGAITVTGSLSGGLGALLVVLVGFWAFQMPLMAAVVALAAAVAGFFFDTLLGASLERRGWLGNDLVNFVSVGFAGLVAWLLLVFVPIR